MPYGCSTFIQTPTVSTTSSFYRLVGSTTKYLAIDSNSTPHIIDSADLKSSTSNVSYNPQISDLRLYLRWKTGGIDVNTYSSAIGTARINNGLVRYLTSDSTGGANTMYSSASPLCYVKIPESMAGFYFQQGSGTDELGNTIYYKSPQYSVDNSVLSLTVNPPSITIREFEAVATGPDIQYYSTSRGLVYPVAFANGVFTNGDADIIFGYGIDYYNTQYYGYPAQNIISYSPSIDDPWVYYNIIVGFGLTVTCKYIYSPIIAASPSISIRFIDNDTIELDGNTQFKRTAVMTTNNIPNELSSVLPSSSFTRIDPAGDVTGGRDVIGTGSGPPFGYDIIVVAGQSNALGVYSTAASTGTKFDRTVDDRILQLKRNPNWAISDGTSKRLRGINPAPTDSFSASIDCVGLGDDPGSDIGGGLFAKVAREPTIAESADPRVFCCINFALKFCKDYKNNNKLGENRKILLVHVAQGSTPLTVMNVYSKNKPVKLDGVTGVSWHKDEPRGGNLRTLVVDTVNLLKDLNSNNRVACFLWQQGEEDAAVNATQQGYADALAGLVSDFRNAARDPTVPFLAGGFTNSYQTNATAGITNVMNALKNPGISDYYYVGDGRTNSLQDDSASTFAGGPNGIHYNANGQFGLAALYTAAYNRIPAR
jgi:hypothetical protein